MDFVKEEWTPEDYGDLLVYLRSAADEEYKSFHLKLIPGGAEVIGVRIPVLRYIAKRIAKGDIDSFLSLEKGVTNEELIIEGLVLASKRCGYKELLEDMLRFASGITNWSVCDTVKFNSVSKWKDALIKDIDLFLNNTNPWVQRYGFKILMDQYLEDKYIDFVIERTVSVRSDFYYVQMMLGWLLATAAVKFPDRVLSVFEKEELCAAVQNIAIQKIRESRRISDEIRNQAALYKRVT